MNHTIIRLKFIINAKQLLHNACEWNNMLCTMQAAVRACRSQAEPDANWSMDDSVYVSTPSAVPVSRRRRASIQLVDEYDEIPADHQSEPASSVRRHACSCDDLRLRPQPAPPTPRHSTNCHLVDTMTRKPSYDDNDLILIESAIYGWVVVSLCWPVWSVGLRRVIDMSPSCALRLMLQLWEMHVGWLSVSWNSFTLLMCTVFTCFVDVACICDRLHAPRELLWDLWDPLRTRAIPERLTGVITALHKSTFTFTFTLGFIFWQRYMCSFTI